MRDSCFIAPLEADVPTATATATDTATDTATVDTSRWKLDDLRTPQERTRFAVAITISGLAWFVLFISLLIVYAAFIGLFALVGQLVFLGWIRGNGVKVSAEQLPELHASVVRASERLGLSTVPETYVMQAGGALNALAMKVFSRNVVIVYSDLIDACEGDPKALEFVVGHEVGHLALGHLKWQLALLPSHVIPLLGAAYSRAREYSCDRCGLAVTGDPGAAERGLAILAAGGKVGRSMALDAYVQQRVVAAEIWPAVAELGSSHPFLPKRIAAMRNFVSPGSERDVPRNAASYPLALFVGGGFAGAAGGLVSLNVMVVIIGILAAIAIPNFVAMQYRAKRAEVPSYVDGIRAAEMAYQAAFGTYLACGTPEDAVNAVGREQRAWEGEPVAACLDQLGWRPDGQVRGAYWVEVAADGSEFIVHGVSDVDGDTNLAHYTASSQAAATMESPMDVY